MRPPASDLQDLSYLPNHDVTSGVCLAGVSDWKNLTTDNSIQIAHLDDLTITETSFYQSQGHTNCLTFVDTIESPTGVVPHSESSTCELGAREQVKDNYFTKTLVTLNSLATTSGRLLDSRLIFSPSCAKNATADSNKRKGRVAGSNRYTTIPGASTGNTGKLWHSDSELFVPVAETIQMESKSVENIPSLQMICTNSVTEPQHEGVTFVKPLAEIKYKCKVCEVKPVQMLSSCQTKVNTKDNSARASETTETRPQGAVSKVYSKLSKSLKKTRKSIKNTGHLNDFLFKIKDSINVESRDNRLDETSRSSNTMVKQRLHFESRQESKPNGRQARGKENNSKLAVDRQTTNFGITQHDANQQTGSQSRRLPILGVRSKDSTTLTIDNLDKEIVWELKKRLINCNKKMHIKTNGSLRFKSNSCNNDKSRFCSPKRSANIRYGTTGNRQTRTCIVSTV